MKRCLKLTAIIFTLMLLLSACVKGETDYTPVTFGSTVSFSAENYQYKGDFVFEKDGESKFTVTEPQEIKGCVVNEEIAGAMLNYEGISADTFSDSSAALLFSAVRDFSNKTHKIPSSGIKNIEGTVNGRQYTVEFDCSKRKIQKVMIGKAEFIFL